MFDVTHRDGHGRVANWQHGCGAQTPSLVFPDVPGYAAPDGAIRVTSKASGNGIEIVATGTWFYKQPTEGELLLAAPEPGTTTTAQVLPVGDDVAVFHDAGGWASDPGKLIEAWVEAKNRATPGRLFWAPALGTPADYALWVYLGVDLLDTSPLMLAAVRGQATTMDGVKTAQEMAELHGGEWNTARLWQFNVETAQGELQAIRHAIQNGRLRQLVERRIYHSPSTVEVLRRFDREHNFLQSAMPRAGEVIPCMTWESLWMPEVDDYRNRFQSNYTPPEADVLVLLPCSARKPYRLSPSHKRFARALDDSGKRHHVHEVMITSPLGIVPRELENHFPCQQYDVPVTGAWNLDEHAIIRQQLAALLAKGSYKHVIAHIGGGTFEIIRDLVPNAIHTVENHPTHRDDTDRLRDTLRGLDMAAGDNRVGGKARKIADLRALASMQFGPDAAVALTDEGYGRGKAPYIKLFGPEGQRGQTTEKGNISLTMEGAAAIGGLAKCRVFIGDFSPKKTSSLFAVGVESADPDVRVGDEVLVMHGNEIRAVGIAKMSSAEMTHCNRGVAVALRHVGAITVDNAAAPTTRGDAEPSVAEVTA